MVNQKPYIEEGHIIPWSGEKEQNNNDLQKITQKTKHRKIGTALSPGDDIGFCEKDSSSCFTSDTRRASDK
jgi:hypothetical protein